MSVKDVVVEVPIWAKLLQVVPRQRSMRYWDTPRGSVEAVHESVIWEELPVVTSGSTATAAACQVAAELIENVES